MTNIYRTHTLGNISEAKLEEEVILSGWVYRKRDHGGVLFIDLRDHYGIIQLVFHNEISNFHTISLIKLESVLTIKGTLIKRSNDTINNEVLNGDIEVNVISWNIESEAEALPFPISNEQDYPEEIRLKYRYLDLRRPKIKEKILLRSAVINDLRNKMIQNGFIEIQTPILTASSPEGARDYLVPSRLHPGRFYALPQAPQQFKQILMVAGFDKYFQIAPCFRDEDARADRSPGEFYQLDIEMAFVTQEDIMNMIEPILKEIFRKYSNKAVNEVFPIITYKEALNKYGSDKPDLRNPLILADVTEIFRDSEFTIFKNNIKQGMLVKSIPAPGTGNFPRSYFDKNIEYAITELGAKGLGYINITANGEAKGPIAKFLTAEKLKELQSITDTKAGDSIFFSCAEEKKALQIAGQMRKVLAEELDLIEKNCFKFCWIVDFPFFEYNETTKKLDFSHNPFSMPKSDLQNVTEEDLLKITAYQYDIVCNGVELSSGAIRNHRPQLMYKAFELVGYTKEEVEQMFGSLIRAFKFGAPPHGGLAPGIDRMVMLLADEENIREIIYFPMNQNGEDLLLNAPCTVAEKHLKELKIKSTA